MQKIIKRVSAGAVMATCVVFFIAIASVNFSQAQVNAQPSVVIPCDGPECTFQHFVRLVQNVLTFLILLSIPIATLAFAWAGILMLTAAGNSGQVDKAKGIFWNVLKGFLFVLTAWLIVKMITSALLSPGNFTDLLQ
jgi:hypothetical protein